MPETIPDQLEQAPDHIKLAVDLIEMLESANLSQKTVINALEIVINDFKKK